MPRVPFPPPFYGLRVLKINYTTEWEKMEHLKIKISKSMCPEKLTVQQKLSFSNM